MAPVNIPENDHTDPNRSAQHAQVAWSDRLEIHIAKVGSLRLSAEWSYTDLCAPYWRLYRNHADGAAIGLPGRRFPIPAQRPVVVPPWLHWSAIPGLGLRHDYLQFLTPSVGDGLLRRCVPEPLVLTPQPALMASLDALFARLDQDCPQPDPQLLLIARSVAALALAETLAGLPELAASELGTALSQSHPVQALAATISADPAADWSTPRLAALLGCSSDHATRLFRRHLGDTPARVVTQRRLSAAARALASSDASLESIAEACGFANRFSFTRAFTRHFGQGPASWRKSQH